MIFVPKLHPRLGRMSNQVEHTRVLNVVYRSATAIGSRLPSLATAKAPVSGAEALLRPVSSSTQVVIKLAQNVPIDPTNAIAWTKHLADGDLWNKLERELRRSDDGTYGRLQEEDTAKTQIVEEEKVLVEAAECKKPFLSSDIPENHRVYPPGRIVHIVSTPISERTGLGDDSFIEEHIGIYATPRNLYSKLCLSKTMVNDHYMPMYKKMMERLTKVLENDQDCICE